MSTVVSTDQKDDVTIVKLGRYDEGARIIRQLYEKVSQEVEAGHRLFILDLSELRHFDSTLLGELVRVVTLILRYEGKIVLLPLRTEPENTIRATRLGELFVRANTIDEAIQLLKSSNPTPSSP